MQGAEEGTASASRTVADAYTKSGGWARESSHPSMKGAPRHTSAADQATSCPTESSCAAATHSDCSRNPVRLGYTAAQRRERPGQTGSDPATEPRRGIEPLTYSLRSSDQPELVGRLHSRQRQRTRKTSEDRAMARRAATSIQLIEHFLTHLAEDRACPRSTTYTYMRSFMTLLEVVPNKHLRNMTTDDLRLYVRLPMRQARGNKPAGSAPSEQTKNRRVSELRSLFSWLYVEGLIDQDPSRRLDFIDVVYDPPVPITRSTWCDLYALDLSDTDRVGFGMMTFCGLRREEISLLEPGSFVGDRCRFRRKGGKRANLPWLSNVRRYEERLPMMIGGDIATFMEPLFRLFHDRKNEKLLLGEWCRDDRRRARKYTPAPERGTFIDPTKVNRRLTLALLEADHPGDEATPHMLRKRCASDMLNVFDLNIVTVMRFLDHADPKTTERYIETKEDEQEETNGDVLRRFTRR